MQASRNVEIGQDGRRETILEDPEAYARLRATLDAMATPDAENPAPLLNPANADAIRLIALTGARRSEITGFLRAKWTSRKVCSFAHRVGLPSLAADLLRRQPEGGPDDPVFPAPNRNAKQYLDTTWRKVRVAAELPEGIGLHGLRHTFASYMAMQGAQAAEIMAALGHKNMTTSQHCVHWANDQMQQLAERGAARITGALTGGKDAERESGMTEFMGILARPFPDLSQHDICHDERRAVRLREKAEREGAPIRLFG